MREVLSSKGILVCAEHLDRAGDHITPALEHKSRWLVDQIVRQAEEVVLKGFNLAPPSNIPQLQIAQACELRVVVVLDWERDREGEWDEESRTAGILAEANNRTLNTSYIELPSSKHKKLAKFEGVAMPEVERLTWGVAPVAAVIPDSLTWLCANKPSVAHSLSLISGKRAISSKMLTAQISAIAEAVPQVCYVCCLTRI
jgi:hypothetical protein